MCFVIFFNSLIISNIQPFTQEPTTSSSSAITSWGTASYSNPAIDVTLLAMAALSPLVWRSVSWKKAGAEPCQAQGKLGLQASSLSLPFRLDWLLKIGT